MGLIFDVVELNGLLASFGTTIHMARVGVVQWGKALGRGDGKRQ